MDPYICAALGLSRVRTSEGMVQLGYTLAIPDGIKALEYSDGTLLTPPQWLVLCAICLPLALPLYFLVRYVIVEYVYELHCSFVPLFVLFLCAVPALLTLLYDCPLVVTPSPMCFLFCSQSFCSFICAPCYCSL